MVEIDSIYLSGPSVMWMIWTELVFDFLTICSDLSEDRCTAVLHDKQPSSILYER